MAWKVRKVKKHMLKKRPMLRTIECLATPRPESPVCMKYSLLEMETFYVFTSNGRIFYTSISLNDRFTQYQDFSPIGYGQDYRGYQDFNPEGYQQDYRGYQDFNPEGYQQDYRGYQVFNPEGYEQDYRGYFINRAPKRRSNEIYQRWNRFEKAPVMWDSNYYENSYIWTFFSESPWGSSEQQHESEIYKPVANIKRKRKKRKKRTRNSAREAVTKEQLDEELDYYMINVQ